MNTCEYLARVGFVALNTEPTPSYCDDEDDSRAVAESEEVARLADHARVRELLLSSKPKDIHPDKHGVAWLGRKITWPDRVPGLKTWAANQSLTKIIVAHQRRLADSTGDLFAVESWLIAKKNEGPSGLDALNCQDATDIGFSPSVAGVNVLCRPGLELLAVVGLETVPLVSFGSRECGFLRDGQVWRFTVEPRGGSYFSRWGALASV